MRQLILITDGCSNSGSSPVAAAAQALCEGITVNVIGILDEAHEAAQGLREIEEIAQAGGGMSRAVYVRHLSQTMQMMTRQTVAHTIQQVVNKQLANVFGQPQIQELPPAQKAKVVEVMDVLQETAQLNIALLIDTSLSMKSKLRAVEEAIADLVLNLKSRQGKSELCLYHFPAESALQPAKLLKGWSSDLSGFGSLFANLRLQGVTPTGPAILQVMDELRKRTDDDGLRLTDRWSECAG